VVDKGGLSESSGEGLEGIGAEGNIGLEVLIW